MVRLRDLGQWSGGNTPSKARDDYWTNGTVPWVSPKDMKTPVITSSEDRISEVAMNEGRASLLPSGAVLVVTRSGILSHTLPVATTRIPVTINQDLKALVPRNDVLPSYVAYALRSASQRILKCCSKHGTTVASIETNAFLDFVIPMVELAEQRRIVAEIEKQFSRLDEAVANLQRVKANLKRYKAAVLKTAVEGRLVETEASLAHREGRSYETGGQLLRRILERRRSGSSGRGNFKEPVGILGPCEQIEVEGWSCATYAQLGEVTTGFTPPTADRENFDGTTPFFKPTDLDAGDNVYLAREYLSEKGVAKGRKLPAGSVLVTCIGATIGKVGLAALDCTTNQQINAVSPVPELIDSRFVYWWTSSPDGQRQIIEGASATTLPIISKGKFEALRHPLPPLAEQRRIVAEVDRQLSILRGVEAEVEANLQRAQRLRQATLAKAFVPNESN